MNLNINFAIDRVKNITELLNLTFAFGIEHEYFFDTIIDKPSNTQFDHGCISNLSECLHYLILCTLAL